MISLKCDLMFIVSFAILFEQLRVICPAKLLACEEKRKEIVPVGHPGSQVAGLY